MKQISDHSGILETSIDCVLRLLSTWRPDSFELGEGDHEDHLKTWLESELPGVPIATQYGVAKGRADIVLQDQHLIELKLGFSSSNVKEFDRCLGQMERYRQKWVEQGRGPVYLVLVGDSDSELKGVLENWFKRANGVWLPTVLHEDNFYLIEKIPALE